MANLLSQFLLGIALCGDMLVDKLLTEVQHLVNLGINRIEVASPFVHPGDLCKHSRPF